MLKAKFIGIGAAGNKAVINLVEKGVVDKKDIRLLNSTTRDIPTEYQKIAYTFKDSVGGCGKEREIAKSLALNSLRENDLDLDSLLDPDDNMVIIVNSSEGGTGCGASSIIADYMSSVVGANVHMFVFTGFEEDGRGLQNTVEYFQDLKEGYIVQAISNKKFLEVTGNKLKAEKAANDEFAKRVKVLLGHVIEEAEQNIDDTDLYKISTTPGYMSIEIAHLDKVKNVEMFNKIVADAIDNSKSLDFEPTAKRIGVILNISEKTKECVDYSFSIIKEKFGTPYEIFTHIQDNEDTKEFIAIEVSGMTMPLDEVKEIYERYKQESSKVHKRKDDFFSFASDFRGNQDDAMFDMRKKDIKNPDVTVKRDFFGSYNMQPPAKGKEKFKNTNIVNVEPSNKDIKNY